MSREIELTQGLKAIVDDEDYPRVARHKWSAHRKGPLVYAVRATSRTRPPARLFYMHWEIVPACPGRYIDHVNGDGLDNRRANLRLVDQFQNGMNAGLSSANTAGFKGIYLDKRRGMWVAEIQVVGRREWLGHFATPREAAHAYDEAAVKGFGKFARTNQMLGLL